MPASAHIDAPARDHPAAPRMTARTLDLPEGFCLSGALEAADLEPSRRSDGWTPDRQRSFLGALAEGATVESAAAHVGLSPQSAYAFRQRAAGAAFAVGWHAALLLQRQKLADALHSRAFDGQVDTLTRPDGSVVQRHRHDNRLGLALLARLDRLAAADDRTDRHGEAQAARLVAGEWQRYLDLIAADATPAQAALFLAARATTPAAPAKPTAADPVDALAPVVALARADIYLRTGAGDAAEIDTADLDPARRAGWTAEQWARAEAAGLVALAPNPQIPQHSPEPVAEFEDEPVWYDDASEEWRTIFPPPPGIYVDEHGRYGDVAYDRSLTPEEEDLVEPERRIEEAVRSIEQGRERDAWFAARRAERDARDAERQARYAQEEDWDVPVGAVEGAGSAAAIGREGNAFSSSCAEEPSRDQVP